jgi:branched-chain amino acid transport system permease protein
VSGAHSEYTSGLKPRARAAEFIFWVLPPAAYFMFPDNLLLLSQVAIAGLFALSFDLILGYAGIISLGHAAFFGLGAYTAGLLARHGWQEPLSGLVAAAVIAALGGWLSSFLVLRGNDLARLMVTLGVSLMLYEAANKLNDFTGGVDGVQGIEMGRLFGVFAFDLYGRTAYVYSLGILFVVFMFVRRLTQSPFGLSLRGIRDNAQRMPALGTPVAARLVAAYTLGAAIAGIAGALLAQTTQYVALDALSFNRSAQVLAILVLGGAGHLYGALLGAIVFMVAQSYFSDLNAQYWQFWLGALLIAVVLFARDGIVGGLMALERRLLGPRA